MANEHVKKFSTPANAYYNHKKAFPPTGIFDLKKDDYIKGW